MSARSWTAPALWRFGKDHVLQSPAVDAARKAAQILREHNPTRPANGANPAEPKTYRDTHRE